jgi:hypothetical protein
MTFIFTTLKGWNAFCKHLILNPFRVAISWYAHPRVARSSQPRAERFNPVGIELTNEIFAYGVLCSTENSEEPLIWLVFFALFCALLRQIRLWLWLCRAATLGEKTKEAV